MADNNDSRSSTLTAYGFKREGRKSGRWLEIGTALAEGQVTVPIRVRLDRLTIGFTGGVMLLPTGQEPPLPEAMPHRPGSGDADADDE
jgi:hypothetical protein